MATVSVSGGREDTERECRPNIDSNELPVTFSLAALLSFHNEHTAVAIRTDFGSKYDSSCVRKTQKQELRLLGRAFGWQFSMAHRERYASEPHGRSSLLEAAL